MENKIKEYTYTFKDIPFVFIEDVYKIIGMDKIEKWKTVSLGSTHLLLNIGSETHSGIYVHDLIKFITLDNYEK